MKEIFETYSRSVETLLRYLPAVHKAAMFPEALEGMPGWDVLQGRPREFVRSGGRPIMVGMLLGPTGAGKSALFRAITGIDVPSGIKRPTSYNCVVAVPEGALDGAGIRNLFPNYEISEMKSAEVLADRTRGEGELFFAFYHAAGAGGVDSAAVNLVLADVPDFNSVERENWTRAEKMLARAEVVVFITHREGYKDERVVAHLAKVCQSAGHLVYVFSGAGEADAGVMWNDLLEYARGAGSFAAVRQSDGLRLRDFLQAAFSYYWPDQRPRAPILEEVKPMHGDAPAFSSFLTGLDAARVILLSLMAATPDARVTCRKVVEEAKRKLDRWEGMVATAAGGIAEQAEFVAGTQFPAGRWAELVEEVARQERPGWLKWMSAVSFVFARTIEKFRNFFFKQKDDLRPREEIERERLRDATEQLVNQWRGDFGELREGPLSAEKCRAARDAFDKLQPPEVEEEWDNAVRAEARKWARAHPILSTGLASTSDLLLLGGAAILAIPFLHHVGLLAAAAAGNATASLLINLAKTVHLDGVLESADEEWRKQRKIEIQNHIQAKFADPLFLGMVKEWLAGLQSAPVGECVKACDALEELERRFAKESWTNKQ